MVFAKVRVINLTDFNTGFCQWIWHFQEPFIQYNRINKPPHCTHGEIILWSSDGYESISRSLKLEDFVVLSGGLVNNFMKLMLIISMDLKIIPQDYIINKKFWDQCHCEIIVNITW